MAKQKNNESIEVPLKDIISDNPLPTIVIVLLYKLWNYAVVCLIGILLGWVMCFFYPSVLPPYLEKKAEADHLIKENKKNNEDLDSARKKIEELNGESLKAMKDTIDAEWRTAKSCRDITIELNSIQLVLENNCQADTTGTRCKIIPVRYELLIGSTSRAGKKASTKHQEGN